MKKCSRGRGQKTLFQSWNKQNKAKENKRLFDTWDEPCCSTSGSTITTTNVGKNVDNMIILDAEEDEESILAAALEQIDQQDGNLSFSANNLNNSVNNDESVAGFDYSSGNHWIYPINYPIREYQFNIVKNALFKNTLVTLPTGLGKTFIAAVVMYNFYRWFPQGKIIFMAPTKPLVAQQIEACYNIMGIPKKDTAQLTGSMAPPKRENFWVEKRVFFMTPQVFQNDISRGSCHAEDIVCIVIDEAHKALGNHAYCQVIREVLQCNKKFRVLSLSATPGDDLNTVQEILTNLLVSHIELRSEESVDIKPYTHERQVETIVIPLGDELQFFKNKFLRVLSVIINKLFSNQLFWLRDPDRASKYALLAARDQFRRKCTTGEQPRNQIGVIEGDFAVAISFYHAYELMLQHGLLSFYNFIKGIVDGSKGSSRAKMELSRNPDFVALMEDLRSQIELPSDNCNTTYSTAENRSNINPSFIGHPKLNKLKEVVLEHFQSRGENTEHVDSKNGSRVMIFSQYRDSVYEIANMFSVHHPLVRVMRFIGQQSRANNTCKGLTQKEQTEVIRQFRNGDYNTLVATSVGEEGLDIGEVDLIICFDASASPIRLVQRMGRTGRKRQGRVVVLVTEGKEEQTYKKSQRNKTSIQKGILQCAKKLELYSENARMVPRNIHPACQKLFITVEKTVESDNKKNKKQEKNSKIKGDIKKHLAKSMSKKDDGFLTTQELSYWNEHFKLPQHEAGLTPVKNRLQPSKVDDGLSLNEWTAWQTSLQPYFFVDHSLKSRHLAEILEFCDFRRDCGTDDDSYNLEMKSFLNMDDVVNTEENIECNDAILDTSTSETLEQRKDSSKGCKTSKKKGKNKLHTTKSSEKLNDEVIEELSNNINDVSEFTACYDEDNVVLEEIEMKGKPKKRNRSNSSESTNEPSQDGCVNVEESGSDNKAMVKTTCDGNKEAPFLEPKCGANKMKLKKNGKKRWLSSFDVDDDFEADTSFLCQKLINAESRKKWNEHEEVINESAILDNQDSEDELTKLLDIPCSQRPSKDTKPLPDAPSLDTLFNLCDLDNGDIPSVQPERNGASGAPTMVQGNPSEQVLKISSGILGGDAKENNGVSEKNNYSTDEELPRCDLEGDVDELNIENSGSEEIEDEYLKDILLDDLKTPCLFDEQCETPDDSCRKYRRIGRTSSPDDEERTPRKHHMYGQHSRNITSRNTTIVDDQKEFDSKEDKEKPDHERTTTNKDRNEGINTDERTISESCGLSSVDKIRSFSFIKPIKEQQASRSLDPNDFRLPKKMSLVEDDLVAPSPQKEILHRSFISSRKSLNVSRNKTRRPIFKEFHDNVSNVHNENSVPGESVQMTGKKKELTKEVGANKIEGSEKKENEKMREDSPVFPHLTTPKITEDFSIKENTCFTHLCEGRRSSEEEIFQLDVDDQELLDLVETTSQEFGIEKPESVKKTSLKHREDDTTIRTPNTSDYIQQRIPNGIQLENSAAVVRRKTTTVHPEIVPADSSGRKSSAENEDEDSPIVIKRGKKCMSLNKERHDNDNSKLAQKPENKEEENNFGDSPILRRCLNLTKLNRKSSNSPHYDSDVVFNGEIKKTRSSKYFNDPGKRRRSTESDEEFQETRNGEGKPANKQLKLSKNRKREKQQDNVVNMFLDQEAEVSDDHNQSSDQDIGTSDDNLEDSFIDDRTQLTQRSPLVMKSRKNQKVEMIDIYRGSLMTPYREELKFSTPAFHRYKNCYKMVYNKNTSVSSRSEYDDDYESCTEEEDEMDEINERIDNEINETRNTSHNISPEASQLIMKRDRRKRKVLSDSESPERSPILNQDIALKSVEESELAANKVDINDGRRSFDNFKKPFSEMINERKFVRPVATVTALCHGAVEEVKDKQEDMDELLAALEQSDDYVFMEIDDLQTSTKTTTTPVSRNPSISETSGISENLNSGVHISQKQSFFHKVPQSRVGGKEQGHPNTSSVTHVFEQSERTSLLLGDNKTTTKTELSPSNIHHTSQNKTGDKVSLSASVSTATERSNNKLTILVSSAEVSNCQITSFLRRNHNINAVVSKLDGCDYVVSNRMGVERRLVSDISNASNMNRLIGRIRELCDLYDRPCLIIETDRLKRKETNNNQPIVRSKHFNRVLACLTHIKVLFSNDQENTASILASLAHVEVRKKAHIVYTFPLTKERQQVVKFLCSIPRISYITAVSLCFDNRSLQEIANSSVEELVKRTNNLCPNRASNVINFMKHNFSSDMVQAGNT